MKRSKNILRKGKGAAAYIRVSDDSQLDGHSLEAQRTEIERWCERRGYQLAKIYAEEGQSAHTDRMDRRPQLMALLHDAEAGQFDIVVVHMLDRWARNSGVQRQTLQLLGEHGVGFASVMEDFDYTTPSGKYLLSIMGANAEFFSDQLGAHVSKTQRLKAQKGIPVGPIPFGYRAITVADPPQMIETEAEAVLAAFELRAGGESTGAIAIWLNAQGLKTRKGGLFTSHAVKDMLNCRFYLGKVRYNTEEYEGQHPAIVAEELFQRAQARIMKRAGIRTVVGPKGILQGLIACGRCGRPVQSDRHRYGGPMYRERHSHECDTNGRSMMAHKVDEQIQNILTSVVLLPEWREEMSRLTITNNKGPNPQELRDKRRRISRAYADGAFKDTEYEAKLAEIDAQLQLTIPMELPTLEEAARLFENIPQLWEEAMPEERRLLLSPLVERVYVDMECRMIGAIVPVPAFRRLLEGAASRAEGSAATLLSEDEAERLRVWSWWRRGRVELPVQKAL